MLEIGGPVPFVYSLDPNFHVVCTGQCGPSHGGCFRHFRLPQAVKQNVERTTNRHRISFHAASTAQARRQSGSTPQNAYDFSRRGVPRSSEVGAGWMWSKDMVPRRVSLQLQVGLTRPELTPETINSDYIEPLTSENWSEWLP